MRFFLAFALAVGVCCSSHALCLAGHPSVAAEAHAAGLIAVGTAVAEYPVVDPQDPDGFIATVFVVRVTRTLKGAPAAVLHLWNENTSARYPMTLRKPHLLFLRDDAEGFWHVESCGHSEPFNAGTSTYRTLQKVLREGRVTNSPGASVQ